MPVRSLTSPVLRWPTRAAVEASARAWAQREAALRPDLLRVGMFGSYARGTAGVGSDLDLLVVVRESAVPFARRAADWDLTSLPVPAELLVYTWAEWVALEQGATRFAATLAREAVWLVGRPGVPDGG
jgi:uncharacterized protein